MYWCTLAIHTNNLCFVADLNPQVPGLVCLQNQIKMQAVLALELGIRSPVIVGELVVVGIVGKVAEVAVEIAEVVEVAANIVVEVGDIQAAAADTGEVGIDTEVEEDVGVIVLDEMITNHTATGIKV